MSEIISQISFLKRRITETVRETHINQLPITFYFKESLTSEKYEITIKVIEENEFTDANGIVWIRKVQH